MSQSQQQEPPSKNNVTTRLHNNKQPADRSVAVFTSVGSAMYSESQTPTRTTNQLSEHSHTPVSPSLPVEFMRGVIGESAGWNVTQTTAPTNLQSNASVVGGVGSQPVAVFTQCGY